MAFKYQDVHKGGVIESEKKIKKKTKHLFNRRSCKPSSTRAIVFAQPAPVQPNAEHQGRDDR